MKKKLYIIGNWKMNPVSQQAAKDLVVSLKKNLANAVLSDNISIVLCPPNIWMPEVLPLLKLSEQIKLGAQHAQALDTAALTGETSIEMLQDFAQPEYILVGHSERRGKFALADKHCNEMILSAFEHSITPVLLLGDEKSPEYHGKVSDDEEVSKELDRITQQLTIALRNVNPDQASKIIFGYEPIWAISGGKKDHKSADPQQVNHMISLIKEEIEELIPQLDTDHSTVIYGGSVNKENALSFLEQEHISGVLPGSASIKPEQFSSIISSALKTLE